MKKSFFTLLLSMMCMVSFAQTYSRSYIREQISLHGECRNVAITKYNGDLMLYGQNGWAAKGCPSGLTTALHELNDNREYIDDVQLTDDGRWLILYGNNGLRWNDIPYSLEQKLRQFNSNREVITSVTFNDDGDWIVVTTEHISASDYSIQNWLKEGNDIYGQLWAVCLTDDACVAVYEEGYKFLGDVPEDLKRSLRQTSIDVYRLKIAGDAWFYSDGKSRYNYNM